MLSTIVVTNEGFATKLALELILPQDTQVLDLYVIFEVPFSIPDRGPVSARFVGAVRATDN